MRAFAPLLTAGLLALWAGSAAAHIGNLPSVALPLEPQCTGTVVDESFVVSWFDRDTEEPEGMAPTLIDLYYSPQMPVTFRPWERPDLDGLLDLALDVPLADPANKLTWDTSEVPTGVYWILSITLDRDFELVAMAPGPVTVAHGDDPVPPSIALIQSDSEPDIADLAKIIEFCAHDPDGTGTVKLEVTIEPDGSDLVTVAEGLPAVEGGTFEWDTSQLQEGDWLMKATLEDARGMKAEAWGRYFVRVYHLRATTGGEGEGEPDTAAEGEGEGNPGVPGDPGVIPGKGEGEGEGIDGGEGGGGGDGGWCAQSGEAWRWPAWIRR